MTFGRPWQKRPPPSLYKVNLREGGGGGDSTPVSGQKLGPIYVSIWPVPLVNYIFEYPHVNRVKNMCILYGIFACSQQIYVTYDLVWCGMVL
jgi:hypothetical protein